MVACRKKEAELLEFTQKLTETNVTIQSECAFTEGRASALESEHTRLTNKGLFFMTNLAYAKEIFNTRVKTVITASLATFFFNLKFYRIWQTQGGPFNRGFVPKDIYFHVGLAPITLF